MPSPNASPDENQSFVLRMRIERSLETGSSARSNRSEPAGRLHIRIEHVNASNVSVHHTVESALDWLRAQIAAVITGYPGTGVDDTPATRQ